ncbi:MAG: CPBP family intramembrane metalloprotease, partial [Candidatus Eisenbacteria sp.]|nr:CPBP family intramembrane metalloprotease [Candidatus Eisenbacteria bacterium]
SARSIFALRRTPFWMVAISAPLALVCAILSGALEALIGQVFPMPEEYAIHLARLLYPENPGQWVRIIAIAVIIIPLGEEMLFRGLFLRGFVLRYGTVPALAFSSLFFAFVHLNPWGFVPIFLAGWLLGWLVLRSGSLWPSVFLHGLYNLYSILMLYTSLEESPSAEVLSQADAGIWGSSMMVAVSALVLVGCIVLIGRQGRRALPWTDSCNAAAS